ncbi:transcriptional regulator [Salmonella enterica subsp. enterica]|nr:transcriptional regulator [Salmonella enterica subsp. enterica serovar Paratyphi A]
MLYDYQVKPKKERMEEKEKEIIQAIQVWVDKKKSPPSMRELTKLVSFKSTSTTFEYLTRMRNKGLITWDKSSPRTLRLLQ